MLVIFHILQCIDGIANTEVNTECQYVTELTDRRKFGRRTYIISVNFHRNVTRIMSTTFNNV